MDRTIKNRIIAFFMCFVFAFLFCSSFLSALAYSHSGTVVPESGVTYKSYRNGFVNHRNQKVSYNEFVGTFYKTLAYSSGDESAASYTYAFHVTETGRYKVNFNFLADYNIDRISITISEDNREFFTKTFINCTYTDFEEEFLYYMQYGSRYRVFIRVIESNPSFWEGNTYRINFAVNDVDVDVTETVVPLILDSVGGNEFTYLLNYNGLVAFSDSSYDSIVNSVSDRGKYTVTGYDSGQVGIGLDCLESLKVVMPIDGIYSFVVKVDEISATGASTSSFRRFNDNSFFKVHKPAQSGGPILFTLAGPAGATFGGMSNFLFSIDGDIDHAGTLITYGERDIAFLLAGTNGTVTLGGVGYYLKVVVPVMPLYQAPYSNFYIHQENNVTINNIVNRQDGIDVLSLPDVDGDWITENLTTMYQDEAQNINFVSENGYVGKVVFTDESVIYTYVYDGQSYQWEYSLIGAEGGADGVAVVVDDPAEQVENEVPSGGGGSGESGSSFWDSIFDSVGGALGGLASLVAQLLGGIVDGVASFVTGLWDMLSGFLSGVGEFFGWFGGESSVIDDFAESLDSEDSVINSLGFYEYITGIYSVIPSPIVALLTFTFCVSLAIGIIKFVRG